MSFFASRWPSGVAPEARWCQLRLRTTVYAIRPGRSFHDAAPILGPDFDGVLVRDGWAPYRQFTDALHQIRRVWRICFAGVGRCGQTIRAAPGPRRCSRCSRMPSRSAIVGTPTRSRIMGAPSRLGRLIAAAPGLPAAARFAAHLTTEFPAVFAFL